MSGRKKRKQKLNSMSDATEKIEIFMRNSPQGRKCTKNSRKKAKRFVVVEKISNDKENKINLSDENCGVL